jgi:hypothetical protein
MLQRFLENLFIQVNSFNPSFTLNIVLYLQKLSINQEGITNIEKKESRLAISKILLREIPL